MCMPILSIIICTYNRTSLLEKCLNGLCQQDARRDLYEVIVVDNNSDDDTPKPVGAYALCLPSLRYVKEENKNLSIARNKGCYEALGQYLLYLDDDAIPPRGYLANILNLIQAHRPDIIGGPVYPYYTSPKPSWFRDKYETKKFTQETGFSKTCRVTGANFSIRKDVLLQLGMFDPDHGMQGYKYVIGDERQILERYRAITPQERQKVYYALECYVQHHVASHKMTLRFFWLRHYIGGRALTKIYKEAHGIDMSGGQLIWKIIRWPYIWAASMIRVILGWNSDGIDIFEVCALGCYEGGIIAEGCTQVLKRQSVKLARWKSSGLV